MSRQKKVRFLYNTLANNVIEKGKELYTTIKGKWNAIYFQNENPIILELACGKGEYTVGLGVQFPNNNYIGVDIKGDRIARGSKLAVDNKLTNIAFLRTGIKYLEEFFVDGEVSEIWLIHPDPQLRDKDEKKRLTNVNFLNLYKKLLKDEGFFRLKTDNPQLYEYTLEQLPLAGFKILNHTSDLYNSELITHHHGIKTHYEKIFTEKGFTINYIEAVKV